MNPIHSSTQPVIKYCFACGAQIDSRAEICPQCGVRQQDLVVRGQKNRIVAALFAFFLGWLGIHKFYLGRIGWGVVYLLLSWTGIPLIVAFVEGIIYLCTSDKEFANKYG